MTLRIRDWDRYFENASSRKLKRLDWVAIPNKTDGEGYTALVDHPNAAAHLGAWYAIVEAASKQAPRGNLPGGISHDIGGISRSLGRMSRLPSKVFEEVLPRLLVIGWLEDIDAAKTESNQQNVRSLLAESADVLAESADVVGESGRLVAAQGRELQGTTGKGIENICSPDGERLPDAEFSLIAVPEAPTNGTLATYQRTWFDSWWPIYWRKVSRKNAEKAFRAHVKTPQRFEEIMTATRAQTGTMMARDPDHRPHGATWLNAERWKDERSQPARAAPHQAKGLVANVERVIGERLARGEKPW